MAAFHAALDAGAGIECDLRMSSDGCAMVFHDADLKRLCGLDVFTESLDAAALMSMRIAGTDETIPPLGDLLALVDGRIPILLELKCAGGNNALLSRAVAAAIGSYRGPLGVMSFEPEVGGWFAAHHPGVRHGIVLDGGDRDDQRATKIERSAAQFLAINLVCAAEPWVAQSRRDWVDIACWTVRSAEQRQFAAEYVDALIWEADGRP
jgi:glycerophosphoryl diester phosphodiesterase